MRVYRRGPFPTSPRSCHLVTSAECHPWAGRVHLAGAQDARAVQGRGPDCSRTGSPPQRVYSSPFRTIFEPGVKSVCGGGGWHKASVSGCLPLAVPIGLSPLLIPTLCGPERVLVVSTEPLDDLSCLTTSGVGRPGDGLLPVPLTRCI